MSNRHHVVVFYRRLNYAKKVLSTCVPFTVSLSTGYSGPRRIFMQKKAAWLRDAIKGTRPVVLLST